MSDTRKFYFMVGDWAMKGSWWRCPRNWWRSFKLTVAMSALAAIARAEASPQLAAFDVGDNVLAVGSGASLLSIMAIVFHAGQLAHRVKSLEVRMSAADEAAIKVAKHAEDLAGLIATVAAMESNLEAINHGIHDIRNHLMTLSRGAH